MMRKQERAVKRAIRDLNKERTALERNEKKMQIDLKKMAQKGQMVLAAATAAHRLLPLTSRYFTWSSCCGV